MTETIRKVISGVGTNRRTVFGRLGAVVVGASAAAFMSAKAAQATHGPPPPCVGLPGCHGDCGPVQGVCCWFATDPVNCRTYRCCDRPDLSPTPWCICRHFIGNFC